MRDYKERRWEEQTLLRENEASSIQLRRAPTRPPLRIDRLRLVLHWANSLSDGRRNLSRISSAGHPPSIANNTLTSRDIIPWIRPSPPWAEVRSPCDILCGVTREEASRDSSFCDRCLKEVHHHEELWSKDSEGWLANKLEAMSEKRAKGRTELGLGERDDEDQKNRSTHPQAATEPPYHRD